ncbi:hypothetical protein ABZP36_025521 [Zizania latifolia]
MTPTIADTTVADMTKTATDTTPIYTVTKQAKNIAKNPPAAANDIRTETTMALVVTTSRKNMKIRRPVNAISMIVPTCPLLSSSSSSTPGQALHSALDQKKLCNLILEAKLVPYYVRVATADLEECPICILIDPGGGHAGAHRDDEDGAEAAAPPGPLEQVARRVPGCLAQAWRALAGRRLETAQQRLPSGAGRADAVDEAAEHDGERVFLA